MALSYPIIVLHTVTSSKLCTEFVKISAGMGFKTVIITNAQGGAAQRGLPSAQKLAMQKEINFMTLSTLEDVQELLQPEEILVIAPPPYGKENLDGTFVKQLEGKRWVAVFGGNDPGLSRRDLEKGTKIVQVPAGDLGSMGTLTLGLALLTGKFQFGKPA